MTSRKTMDTDPSPIDSAFSKTFHRRTVSKTSDLSGTSLTTLHQYPKDLDAIRDHEYPQLNGTTYLDHGGTTLYAKSLIERYCIDLTTGLYGNPHSASMPSEISGRRVEAIRKRALRFFNAEHYELVFVSNATSAIKLVVDCYRDYAAAKHTPFWYGYHKDAHTSLVGGRESAKTHRCFGSDVEVDGWIDSREQDWDLGLFAFPGQSNMTGRRLPLSWPFRIRGSFRKDTTYTLLDAAALATTTQLDLSHGTSPDFVAISFYKIFGFPDLGALLVRKESAHILSKRRYFGGGTVDMIISIDDAWHAMKDSIHDRLEDGTLPFHSIFALDHALDAHERLYGPDPMRYISQHTTKLSKNLFDCLRSLTHNNGLPVCRIYNELPICYGDATLQGAAIAFNILRGDGTMIGYEDFEKAANAQKIYVRSGSLCNPGGMAGYLDWSSADMKGAFAAGHRCSTPTQVMFGKATGVVRVSLGAMSSLSDVLTLVTFILQTYVAGNTSQGGVVSEECRQEEVFPRGPSPNSHLKETKPKNHSLGDRFHGALQAAEEHRGAHSQHKPVKKTGKLRWKLTRLWSDM